jgi:hypothetical protein
MFKKLSAALVAASLVAFAQPALAQAISPIPIEKLPVIVMADLPAVQPSNVMKLNLRYSLSDPRYNSATFKNQVVRSEWVMHKSFTEVTFDGVKNANILLRNPSLPSSTAFADLPQFYCLLSGYVYGYVGTISRVDCSSDKSLIK